MHQFTSRPNSVFLTSLAAAVLLAACVGCGGKSAPEPALLALHPHASGNDQCAPCGQVLEKRLQVVVEGPVEPGLLGGKGSRRPVPNVSVLFEIDADSDAVFVESDGPQLVMATDAAGAAGAQVKLGKRVGDVIVTARLQGNDAVDPVEFRVAAGVEIIGHGKELEGPTGGTLPAFGVRLTDAAGKPVPGVTVRFRAEGGDAQVGASTVTTDEDGRAATKWKLGKKVQQYFALVDVDDRRKDVPESARFEMQPLEFESMALSTKQMAMVMFGGLAVFIFGMKLMSEGLQRMADRRLKAALNWMTRNRFFAVAMGALVTAVIQSSSATTVMTVGFVNAGLMTLAQSIGVVYGANIGTTATAQIIAFKLDQLAYPAIAVGLVMMSVSKKAYLKYLGQAILGFGLLFLGMSTMSGILKPLRHSPSFVAWFHAFDCTPSPGGIVPPIPALMCVLIGTFMTVIIQSSSATVGLVLALASQGLISFYTAVPLVLGDNIGTTITAQFAALGANRNAKRVAMAHTLFNVFGATYMYLLLFVPLWKGQPVFLGFVNAITPGDVFAPNPENILRHVANAHTVFNVFNVILFLPFVGVMARVCQRIIPVTDADRDTVLEYLEPHLLESPTLALQLAINEVEYMVRRAKKSVEQSCAYFRGGEDALRQAVVRREALIDRLQAEITAYLVELSHRRLDQREAVLIPILIHAVNDAERMGDLAENVVEMGELMHEGDFKLSDMAKQELDEFGELLGAQFTAVRTMLEKKTADLLGEITERETQVDALHRRAMDAHIERLEAGACQVQPGIFFLDVVGNLERIGDHIMNIAERSGHFLQITES